MISHRLLAAAYLLFSVTAILWDILYAGRIAQLPRTPRGFQAVTAFAGLLLAPAILVGVAAASILYGRAIQPLSWVWPLTTILFAFQALYAVARRLITPLFGFPLFVYDAIIATVAVAKYTISRGSTPPEFALALTSAHATMLQFFFGAPALWSAIYLQIPLFSPSMPARWVVTRAVRFSLAIAAMAMTALVLVELPEGYAAIQSFPPHSRDQLQEHPDGDFRIGLSSVATKRPTPKSPRLIGPKAVWSSWEIRSLTAGNWTNTSPTRLTSTAASAGRPRRKC